MKKSNIKKLYRALLEKNQGKFRMKGIIGFIMFHIEETFGNYYDDYKDDEDCNEEILIQLKHEYEDWIYNEKLNQKERVNDEKSSGENGTSDLYQTIGSIDLKKAVPASESCLGHSTPSQPSLKVSETPINDEVSLDRSQTGIIDSQTTHQGPSQSNLKEESGPSDNNGKCIPIFKPQG